jgi:hypothetical protein
MSPQEFVRYIIKMSNEGYFEIYRLDRYDREAEIDYKGERMVVDCEWVFPDCNIPEYSEFKKQVLEYLEGEWKRIMIRREKTEENLKTGKTIADALMHFMEKYNEYNITPEIYANEDGFTISLRFKHKNAQSL